MSWNRFVNHLFWHLKQPCIPVPERLPHSQPFDVAVVKTLFWLFSEPACSKRGLQTVDRFLLIKTPTPCWASSHLHQSSEEKLWSLAALTVKKNTTLAAESRQRLQLSGTRIPQRQRWDQRDILQSPGGIYTDAVHSHIVSKTSLCYIRSSLINRQHCLQD